MTNLRDLLQSDARAAIDRIGTDQWLVVYSHSQDGVSRATYFCALVANERLQQALSHSSWDLGIGDGSPGCSSSRGPEGERMATYHRFVTDEGIEPLIFKRSFHGLKPEYVEILEEFRYFHELYYDQQKNQYIRILDSGEEELVAEVKPGLARIKTRAIRQFLAIRRMHLLVFFDIVAEGDVDVTGVVHRKRPPMRQNERRRTRMRPFGR